MQKSVLILVVLCAIVSAKTLPETKKSPTLITYEKLRRNPKDLRLVTTLSILNGALRAEEKMEIRLRRMARDFYSSAPTASKETNLRKIGEIEKSMARDRRAIAMLGAALDLSKTNSTIADYRRTLQRAVRTLDATAPSKEIFSGNVTQQVSAVKTHIERHLAKMHSILEEKGRETMKYLKAQKPKAPAKVKRDEKNVTKPPNVLPVTAGQGPYAGTFVSYVPISNPPLFFTLNTLTDITRAPDDFIAPYVERSRRQDEKTSEETSNAIDNTSKNSNSELSLSEEDSSDDERPGGLVGLIASLSGGDEGSDVGALLGALTGVVTNLFGPGGLDIPSLLSSGTSLLAGLLGGDDNFGKVLAGYVVTAIDGLSGGGAADLNGLFFGNFLGAFLSQLSLDPENEEGPPNPGLFIENVFKGFKEGTRRGGDDGGDEAPDNESAGSSGFFNFISNFVSSIVGGITSFILNASLGSSGGSSQGVADLSGSSSSGSSASSSGSH